MKTLLDLCTVFGLLSLLAVGGGNTVIPQMYHDSVVQYHWLSEQQFLGTYSLSRAAPGPSMLMVTLIGYRAAGFAGAAVATMAMFLPACFLTYFAGKAWDRFSQSPWRVAIEHGLAPITVGLMLSSVWVVAKAAIFGVFTLTVAVLVTIILLRSRVNPILLVLAAGLAGWVFRAYP